MASTPASGPVARIIAGSLAAGAAAALVLTLVVFPGGTESVITGSVLIAFGLGWALIAVLSARHTNRPQRWAAVPAAMMGATGLALLVLTPGYEAMTRLNWVWPPVVLALAVWMFRQVRRSLPRRGRRLLVPVVATLALASLGATYANVTVARDSHAAPGTSVRRGRPLAAPRLPRARRPDRRPLQRPRRDLRLLGPDHRTRLRDRPRLRLRPGRPGLERRRRRPAGRRARRRRPAHPAGHRRRDRALRPGRPLDRRHLRDDLRRAVPRRRSPGWCCWTAPAPSRSPGCPPTPGSTP